MSIIIIIIKTNKSLIDYIFQFKHKCFQKINMMSIGRYNNTVYVNVNDDDQVEYLKIRCKQ